MADYKRDLEREKERYSEAALKEEFNIEEKDPLRKIQTKHRPPFLAYYKAIDELIKPVDNVLDLGAGTGLHTQYLSRMRLDLYALDISEEALKVCDIRCSGNVKIICGNIESLPFEADYFDWIVGTGILSYGGLEFVLPELTRTLKTSGGVTFLDTLNHNPIYRLKRVLHAIRGWRTFSTLRRMPTFETIHAFKNSFRETAVHFFSANNLVFLLLPTRAAEKLIHSKSKRIQPFWNKMAFKFIIIGVGVSKTE